MGYADSLAAWRGYASLWRQHTQKEVNLFPSLELSTNTAPILARRLKSHLLLPNLPKNIPFYPPLPPLLYEKPTFTTTTAINKKRYAKQDVFSSIPEAGLYDKPKRR